MKRTVAEFTRFDAFLQRIQPLSPYGREALKEMKLYTHRGELERWFNAIQLLISLMNDDPVGKDRIEYHLGRLPVLPDPGQKDLAGDDFFLLKRFLAHFRNISELLTEEIRDRFAIHFRSDTLLDRLSLDGSIESFRICDAYSENLTVFRRKLRELDFLIGEARKNHISQIRERTGLDFSNRDFLILDADKAMVLPSGICYREPYDTKCFLVRPIMPESYYSLYAERDRDSDLEKQEEFRIISTLIKEVNACREEIGVYTRGIVEFEKAWLFSSSALRYAMIRPGLLPDGEALRIRKGRFLPLFFECEERGVEYQPLSFSQETAVSVIRGSNMGGKTILLETVGFFQLLVQYGFFVPAEECQVPLFDSIKVIAATSRERPARGLSSFGMEIRSLMDALAPAGEQTLILIDEFAGTTTSDEARALIEALIETMLQRGIHALLTTHILDLDLPGSVRLYRMKGLRKEGLRDSLNSSKGKELEERIRLLNRSMIYMAEPEEISERVPDALIIADCLGLDREIVCRAAKKMGLKDECAKQS